MCVCEQSLEEEECLDKMKGKRTHLRACVNKRVEKKKKSIQYFPPVHLQSTVSTDITVDSAQ